MKQYTFFDRDYYSNNGEFFISGEHYRVLLQKCFEYGSYFSLIVYNPSATLVVELEKWRVDNFHFAEKYSEKQCCRRTYYANTNVYKVLSHYTNDLFKCRLLPSQTDYEDFVFFRKNGSVFFDSVFHEGECSIYPQDKEDVSDILKFGHWLPVNINGVPEIPACDCHLPMPSYGEIIKDSLYILLRKHQLLADCNNYSLKTLSHLINGYSQRICGNTPKIINTHISFLPHWYIGFKFYLLGECNAMTTTEIADALSEAGYVGIGGVNKFFELLDKYIDKSKTLDNSET